MSAAADWVSERRGWQRYGLACFAGLASTFAMPPVYAVPLLFVTFPLLIWLTESSKTWMASFAAGWWFGVGHFAAGVYWVGNALEIVGVPPMLAAPLPLVLALFSAAACAAYWLLQKGGNQRLLFFAVSWTVFEWLRGHLFTGLPWNLTGYVWGFSDSISQVAAYVGPYGLSLVTVAAVCAPALIKERPIGALSTWRPVIAAVLAIATLWVAGTVRLMGATEGIVPGVNLRIVQANISQRDKWKRDQLVENFVAHMTLSEEPGQEAVTAFIWPETAVPYFLDERPAHTVMIGRLLAKDGAIITGALRRDRDADGFPRYYNNLTVIAGSGAIVGSYDKMHLVPFGEYVPLRPLLTALGVEKIVDGAGDYSSGVQQKTIELPGALPPVAPLICYEVIFPGAVIGEGVRPKWLLNLTNDAWYGVTAGPHQHFASARFRAIEQGLPVVRAAGTGISGIIDSYGRVKAKLGLGKRGVLDGHLPVDAPPPPYSLFGDWNLIVLLAIFLSPLVGRVLFRLRLGSSG